jgi:hypothetical protein
MEAQPESEAPTATRATGLHQLARNYVLRGLGEKNFDAIPYADTVTLRAPLCPGGSSSPLRGRENLLNIWWSPLPGLLDKVEVIDTYTNSSLTAVTVEFHLQLRVEPPVSLRITDRFSVNEEGLITEQENFFDPRDVTNPGWR